MFLFKYILLIFLIIGCGSNYKSRYSGDSKIKKINLSLEEKKRINYYKQLRLFKTKKKKPKQKKLRLTNTEKIILDQHIQMTCYRHRISDIKCLQFKKRPPLPCISFLIKLKFKRLESCLDKYLR